MLKRTAVFILICHLFSCTELSQLLKLPILVEHYLEHSDNQKDLSLLHFLRMHYNNGNLHDREDKKDMKLPFKTCGAQEHGAKPLRIDTVHIFVPANTSIDCSHPWSIFYQFSKTISAKGGIWQPPRFC